MANTSPYYRHPVQGGMEILPWILAIIAFVAGIGGRTEGNLEGYPARAREEAANQFAAGRVKAQGYLYAPTPQKKPALLVMT